MTTVRAALRDRLWLAPLLPAVIYALALALNARALIDAVYANADHSSSMFVAQALPGAPHGRTVVLGNIWWAEALGFQLITRHLPDYRAIWEVVPWLSSVVAIGAAAWAVLRVADRWAALLAGLTLACSGSALLPLQFSWNTHALGYANVCLLSAFTVMLVGRGGRLAARASVWAGALALAAVVFGAGAASDSLFEWAGLAPLAITCVAVLWRGPARIRRPMLISTVAVLVGSVAVSDGIHALMRSQGLVSTLIPVHLSAAGKLLPHLGLLVRSIPVLMNGSFSTGSLSAVGALSALCALVILTGTAFAACAAAGELRAAVRRRHGVRQPIDDPRELARLALIVYWATGAVILALAFVCSSLAVDIAADRYLVTVAYAVVVIAAIGSAGRLRARAAATVGATIVISASALAIAHHYIPTQQYSLFPDPSEAAGLQRFASAQHLRYGYAAYWDAAPLTWYTDARVDVYPTRGCAGHTLCPYGRPRISSWYAPRRGAHSFLIVDRRLIAGGKSDSLGVLRPPRALGRPVGSTRIGALSVYVYDYDIATRFGHPINP